MVGPPKEEPTKEKLVVDAPTDKLLIVQGPVKSVRPPTEFTRTVLPLAKSVVVEETVT